MKEDIEENGKKIIANRSSVVNTLAQVLNIWDNSLQKDIDDVLTLPNVINEGRDN